MEAGNGLTAAIAEFACRYVGEKCRRPKWPATPKIVHDPLWGSIMLEPWEIAVLDLPLIQRLRQIRQNSFASYVFPGCSHSRFEHTLGVIHHTQKLAHAANGRPSAGYFDDGTIRDLRLAALFHDCGHGCFSHSSEDAYQFCPDIEPVIGQDDSEYCGSSPHEVLGALVLKSEPVREYLREVSERYSVEFHVDRAAGWIVGQTEGDDAALRFRTQVINGPFDADKLDYIFRDAHYSGLPLGLDLDRLWARCTVSDRAASSGPEKVLTLHMDGTTALEQILFSKLNLFSVVYQHPKVRAVEAMFHGVVECVRKGGLTVGGRTLRNATDYLWVTDETFFAAAFFTG